MMREIKSFLLQFHERFFREIPKNSKSLSDGDFMSCYLVELGCKALRIKPSGKLFC